LIYENKQIKTKLPTFNVASETIIKKALMTLIINNNRRLGGWVRLCKRSR